MKYFNFLKNLKIMCYTVLVYVHVCMTVCVSVYVCACMCIHVFTYVAFLVGRLPESSLGGAYSFR